MYNISEYVFFFLENKINLCFSLDIYYWIFTLIEMSSTHVLYPHGYKIINNFLYNYVKYRGNNQICTYFYCTQTS